jgi:hypothetical protein
MVMMLRNEHYRNLAAICGDIAQVSLASVTLPYFLDEPRPALALLGLAASFTFWLLSFFALNRVA